jgi:MFS family permease
MTQTSVLDFTTPRQRGLVIGLNEFAGYVGVAVAGIATGYAADWLGPRAGLLWFGAGVIVVATLSSLFAVVDSRPWLALHPQQASHSHARALSTWSVFRLMTWQDKRMAALSQAGLVEKFVDALVWIIWPIYLMQQGLSLPAIGWVVGSYGITWGVAQLLTGPWSDLVGRHRLNVAGMWLCGLGVCLFPMAQSVTWWSSTAVLTGLGMAMLYPNLSAAVVDHAAPAWRTSAIGIYRFWRDIGYAVGAAGIGMVAFATGNLESSFGFVATSMFMSAAYLAWRGQEPDVGPKQSLHFHGIGVKD